MRDNAQEKGDTNEVRGAKTFVLPFLQAIGEILDAWGTSKQRGNAEKKNSTSRAAKRSSQK